MVNLTDKTTVKSTFDLTLEFEETGEEVVEVYPLERLDWVKIEDELGQDVLQKITQKFQKLGQAARDQGKDIRELDKDEIQELAEQEGVGGSLFDEIGTREQLYMYYYAFVKIDDDLAEMPKEEGLEVVSDLITNGLKDQGEYYKCLMFLFYGERQEKIKEEADLIQEETKGGSGNQK